MNLATCKICNCGFETPSDNEAAQGVCSSCREERNTLTSDLKDLADEQRETIRALTVKNEMQQQEIARLRRVLSHVQETINDIGALV